MTMVRRTEDSTLALTQYRDTLHREKRLERSKTDDGGMKMKNDDREFPRVQPPYRRQTLISDFLQFLHLASLLRSLM